MELEDSEGVHLTRMESIKGFLMYVTSTYRDTTPYFKGLHLILDSGIPYIDKEGWILRVGEFNMSELYGKWEGVEELNKSKLVIGVPRLEVELIAIGRLTKEKVPQEAN